MSRYAKYFLGHAIWLEDEFCDYYVQDGLHCHEPILDVAAAIFDDELEARDLLRRCLEKEPYTAGSRLRSFLVEKSIRHHHLVHKMTDEQVLAAVADELTLLRTPIVIQPRCGWAVQLDLDTTQALIPVRVEPEPDLDGLIDQLKKIFNEIVAGQQKKSDAYETLLADMNDVEKALVYGKKAGAGLREMAKDNADGMLGMIALKAKINMLPAKAAYILVRSLEEGNLSPIRNEIRQMAASIAQTYEEAKQYEAKLEILFSEPDIAEVIIDFCRRYYDATHRLELIEMGFSNFGDTLITILLSLVSFGAGAVVKISMKFNRFTRAAKVAQKILDLLQRVGPRHKLPKKRAGGAGMGKTMAVAKKKRMPGVDPTKKTHGVHAGTGGDIDKAKTEAYAGDIDGKGTKTTRDKSIPAKYANRKDVIHRSADKVNAEFGSGWKPPYKKGTRVTEYTNIEPEKFSRVHLGEDARGQWMMRSEAIKGLSPEEIAKKYSLPDVPKYISDVNVPAGTRIRTGTVESNFGGNQGATQYQLLGRIPDSSFGNTRPLR